ncbi:1451_t:CDS:1, partial [Racocetra persica]
LSDDSLSKLFSCIKLSDDSLSSLFSCIKLSDDSMSFDQIIRVFYSKLGGIKKSSKVPEITRKVKQLLSAKK